MERQTEVDRRLEAYLNILGEFYSVLQDKSTSRRTASAWRIVVEIFGSRRRLHLTSQPKQKGTLGVGSAIILIHIEPLIALLRKRGFGREKNSEALVPGYKWRAVRKGVLALGRTVGWKIRESSVGADGVPPGLTNVGNPKLSNTVRTP